MMETGNWVLAMTILAIYIPAISSRPLSIQFAP